MGEIVVTQYLTLDGVMEAPGPDDIGDFKYKGWIFEAPERGPEGDQWKLQETLESDALLLGRVTYETFSSVWPGMGDAPGLTGELAAKFNAMPKYVVSSTLEVATWADTTILRGNLTDEVATLRDELSGRIVIHGSRRLVQGLLGADLVDELRQMIYPVVLGEGEKLFGDTDEPKTFELVEAKTVGEGVVILVHRPRRTGT